MNLENALGHSKETSKILEDYCFIKEIVDFDRPFYMWAEKIGGDISFIDIGVSKEDVNCIKIINPNDKEKLMLIVAIFFDLKNCYMYTKDLDRKEETQGEYMGNIYFLTDYYLKRPPIFENNYLKKGDYIRRWGNLKLFLEELFPYIKENICWNYIKRRRIDKYEIVHFSVYIPIKYSPYSKEK